MVFLKVDAADLAAAGRASAMAALAASVAGGLASGPAPAASVGGNVASAGDPVAAEADDQRTHLQVRASASSRFAVEAVFLDRDRIPGVEEARVPEGGHILPVQDAEHLGREGALVLEEALVRGGNPAAEHILGGDAPLGRMRKDYGGHLVRGMALAVVVVVVEGVIDPEVGQARSRGRGERREVRARQGQD